MTYEIASLEATVEFPCAQAKNMASLMTITGLIMSDGSSKSRFLDPETSVEMGRLKVFDGTSVNELEFVEGKMYANVLPQDRTAIIQPDTGQVTGWIDLVEPKSRMPPLRTRASASRTEWHCLRRYGSRAVCDGQALAKSL